VNIEEEGDKEDEDKENLDGWVYEARLCRIIAIEDVGTAKGIVVADG